MFFSVVFSFNSMFLEEKTDTLDSWFFVDCKGWIPVISIWGSPKMADRPISGRLWSNQNLGTMDGIMASAGHLPSPWWQISNIRDTTNKTHETTTNYLGFIWYQLIHCIFALNQNCWLCEECLHPDLQCFPPKIKSNQKGTKPCNFDEFCIEEGPQMPKEFRRGEFFSTAF